MIMIIVMIMIMKKKMRRIIIIIFFFVLSWEPGRVDGINYLLIKRSSNSACWKENVLLLFVTWRAITRNLDANVPNILLVLSRVCRGVVLFINIHIMQTKKNCPFIFTIIIILLLFPYFQKATKFPLIQFIYFNKNNIQLLSKILFISKLYLLEINQIGNKIIQSKLNFFIDSKIICWNLIIFTTIL